MSLPLLLNEKVWVVDQPLVVLYPSTFHLKAVSVPSAYHELLLVGALSPEVCYVTSEKEKKYIYMYKHVDHHYYYHLLSKQCFIFHQQKCINFHGTLEEPKIQLNFNHINYDNSHKTNHITGFRFFTLLKTIHTQWTWGSYLKITVAIIWGA